MTVEKLKPLFEKWCVWRLEPKRETPDKPAKRPINPNTGGWAKTNDPATFGTYAEAQAAFTGGGHAGLGVLMASGGDTIIVDIDGCIDAEGSPAPVAQSAFEIFGDAYCEISQSKAGLHFVMRGVLPDWVTREKVTVYGHSVEVYSKDSTRFICVTGDEVREAAVIENQAALEVFLRRFGFDEVAKTGAGAPVKGAGVRPFTDTDSDGEDDAHSDADILKLLRQNNKRGKITRLIAGDLKDYGGDHSAADLALSSEIAFYTKDVDQVARIFGHSELAKRDKWREREGYAENTINKAVGSCVGDYFQGRKGAGAGELSAGAALVAAQARYGDTLSGGIEGLAVSAKGRLLPTIDNTIQVLLRDHRSRGVIGFNLFSGMAEVVRPLRDVFGPAASTGVGEFVESDVTAIRAWLGREYGLNVSKHDAFDSVQAWARHTEWNPVTDALSAAHAGWDGGLRLDTWLSDYLGVDATESPDYYKAIGRAFLIGAVARAIQPGCKMDTVLILIGGQGVGKSRAVKILADAICPQAFAENIPMVGESKETALALRGMFIVELAELTSVRKSDSEHVKSFLSATADRGRVPYGRAFETWPRRCVFVGTTNEDEFIQDASGGRRFWTCKVGTIDIVKLQQDASQLWGEAVTAYLAGESWHLTNANALTQAAAQQQQRQVSDSWDDAIADFVSRAYTDAKDLYRPWELFLLFQAVFPQSRADRRDFPQLEQKRFAARLRQAGFENQRVSGGRKRWGLSKARADALIQDFLPIDPTENDRVGMGLRLAAPKVSALRRVAA